MTSKSPYSHLRFIGFAIPTVPADIVPVGDPNGPGAVAGTYRALKNFDQDIEARADLLDEAAQAAFAKLPADDSVLNIFVAPEFYWHGTKGPYAYSEENSDPVRAIMSALEKRFTSEKYPNALFVLGSVITTQVDDLDHVLADPQVQVRNDLVQAFGKSWKGSTGALRAKVFSLMEDFIQFAHANPKLEVRNRALIISTVGTNQVTGQAFDSSSLTTEKYFASNEDFLLWDVTGASVVTEQTVAYPVLDLSGGDLKTTEEDSKAIFDVGGITTGVEICLDHSDQRLRKSTFASPWPSGHNALQLHLIPSCGMQIQPASVATQTGGIAFNCDGQYALGDVTSTKPESGTLSGVASTHVNYSSGGDAPYQAHTQITRVLTGAQGGNSEQVGSHDATFAVPDTDVTVIDLPDSNKVSEVFAGGAGAIHIYGATKPLPVG